jgi:hypothetical protein
MPFPLPRSAAEKLLGKRTKGAYFLAMDLTKLRKLESPSPRQTAGDLQGLVTAIVKVKRPRYRPAGVTVRGDISDLIFTAEFPAERLAALEQDPDVASISLSRPLQSQPR